MEQLKDVDISKLFPSILYRRGMDYYKKGKVSDLLYDRNHHVWTAMVEGTEHYFVEIDMGELAKGSIETYCDCPAYDTYGSCKHIVATLMSIQEKEATTSLNRTHYRKTDRFMQQITELQPIEPPLSNDILERLPVQV